MRNLKNQTFGGSFESLVIPFLLVLLLWLVFWADRLFSFDFYKLGVLPRTVEGIKGIFLMPFIHAKDYKHLLNNSLPIYVLLAALIYFYKELAARIMLVGWILTGFILWLSAENIGAYHIGISGLIYLLAAFLFFSGVLRAYKPLQAISLFVAFFYGSMIWGLFPSKSHVSWEGHLSGFLLGIFFAFYYRKIGPQRPKYQYEIEKEMGIEPIDFEELYHQQIKAELETQEFQKNQSTEQPKTNIIYHFVPKNDSKQ